MNGNSFVIGLLRSPLHGLVSGSMMVLNYIGQKSGKAYSVPVNYYRLGDGRLVTLSLPARSWWRNFKVGGELSLRLQGAEVAARAQAYTTPDEVVQWMMAVLRVKPGYARMFKVGLGADGLPLAADVAREAEKWVAVVFEVGS